MHRISHLLFAALSLAISLRSPPLSLLLYPSLVPAFSPPDTLRWIDAVTETLVACQLLNKQLAKGSLSQETSQSGVRLSALARCVLFGRSCDWGKEHDLSHGGVSCVIPYILSECCFESLLHSIVLVAWQVDPHCWNFYLLWQCVFLRGSTVTEGPFHPSGMMYLN